MPESCICPLLSGSSHKDHAKNQNIKNNQKVIFGDTDTKKTTLNTGKHWQRNQNKTKKHLLDDWWSSEEEEEEE